MNNLSVTVITLNEEDKIERCLDSIKEIANEIIMVDSGSTDKTVEIAKKFEATVYYRKFDNYANQKNFAASKATRDWILSLDADEVVSEDLAKEIESRIKSYESGISGYSIPRKNIIFGKFIKYTRWQPELDRHIWFWRKGNGKWVGNVHEEVVIDGKVGRLNNPKIHYQYETITEFLQMVNRYSEFDAKERVKNGDKFSYFQLLFQPLYNFLVRYIYRLGFLDGWRGFVLSYLMGVYHLVLWVKIWEKVKVKQIN